MTRVHLIRSLKISALAIAGVLALLTIGLICLPALVSSHSVQARLQQSLSASLKRQVTWSNLSMAWSDGLTLSGLTLGDGPPPLLSTDIGRIVIIPSVGRAADGRIGIDLGVRIENVRAELAPGPPKPPPPAPAKDPLTLLAETIQRIQSLDYPVPVDLRIKIEAAPLQLGYRTPAPLRELRLQDGSFSLSMPSLAGQPVTVAAGGRVSLDGRAMGELRAHAKVSDLVTGERRIQLVSALFDVDVSAPGTRLTLSGGLGQAEGFRAAGHLDLPGLQAVAGPLLPPGVPKLEGAVGLLLRAKIDKNRDLQAALAIEGSGLAASGGRLEAKRIGPLELKLQQKIAGDHMRQRVEFPAGSLVIPRLGGAVWSAAVQRPSSPARSLDFQLGPLRLDLARALTLSAPFLAPGTPIKGLAGEAVLRSLALQLGGPKNHGHLAVVGLGVKIPQLRMALKQGELAVEDLELRMDKADCPLSSNLPTRLTAEMLWSARRAALSGSQPLTLQGAAGAVGLEVSDLDLKSASPRKVTASAVMTQSFALERASLGTQLTLENVRQQLRLAARATASGDIEGALPELSLTVAALRGAYAGKRLAPIPLSASLSADGLRLPAGTAGQPTLRRAMARISAGDALQLSAEAGLSSASPVRAVSSGSGRVDLGRLMPFAAAFLPTGLKSDGVVNVVWDLAAPLPKTAPAAENHPLRRARAGLSLFDKLELGLKLDNLSATVPTSKGTISVAGLNSTSDLHVVATRKGESVRLVGGLQLAALSGLAGAAAQMPPQRGTIVFKGELSGWRELRLHQELRLESPAVSQEAELSVNRLDALLEEKQPFNPATLIKRLDASLFAQLEGSFPRQLQQLLPGVDLAGRISSNARIDLTAGRELALRCSLNTNDFDLKLANGTKVEGLRSALTISREYALAAPPGEGWIPLSTSLVRPPAVVPDNPGAAGLLGRIQADLRGNLRGSRTFTIRSVSTRAAGVALELSALEGDLLFSREKAGISYFQADLLGGTLLAAGVIDLRPEVPRMAAQASFSNLDLARLAPQDAPTRQVNQDADITGELSLSAPLTAEQRELFEQLRLTLNLRRIGATTIERALFSLDPYERNEQLVAQRKMLRLGNLKGLRATAVDGAFSMEGEAEIKGIAVDLPRVERLRISELPQRKELEKQRALITALRRVLDLVRADTLAVGPQGELSLKRRTYEQ